MASDRHPSKTSVKAASVVAWAGARVRLLVARARALPRPHPLILLAVVLLALAGVVGVERSMSHRRAALLEARAAHVSALATTRAQLAELLARAATDKTLVQNLNWRLSHSVQSALTAKLQKGALDQVTLVDGGCREVARARLGRSPGLPCPFDDQAAEERGAPRLDSYFWQATEAGPVLALMRQVNGVTGAEVFAVGSVTLDANWIAQHDGLSRATESLDLTIGTPDPEEGSATVLASEGPTGDAMPVAALVSRGGWDGWLLEESASASVPAAAVGPLFLLALTLACWAFWRERHARRGEVERHTSLVDWARTLVPGGNVDLPGRKRPEASPETVRRYVTAALKQRDGDQRLVSRRLAAAEDELTTKEREIKRLTHRLAELAELDSLAVQLARTTKAFLTRMEKLKEDAQDLGDLTGDGLAPCARLLALTLGNWRDGIEQRGARKFLRGLSETPAASTTTPAARPAAPADPDARSRLDEDLALLATLASEVDDQALLATARASQLVEAGEFAVKLAGLWHGIALKTHADKASPSLAQPMEEAQALVRLESPGVDFLNALDPAEIREIPAMPRTVWVTALYHVYLAMAELGRGGAQIVTRLRKDDDRMMLIVQAAARDGRPLPRRGDQEAYHLDVSRSILAPFPVSLTALPSLEGPFPVALGWQLDAVVKAEPGASPRPGHRSGRSGAERQLT